MYNGDLLLHFLKVTTRSTWTDSCIYVTRHNLTHRNTSMFKGKIKNDAIQTFVSSFHYHFSHAVVVFVVMIYWPQNTYTSFLPSFFSLSYPIPSFYPIDMARRVDKWCDPDCQNPECMDVRMPRKLYILVPDSCFCPRTLESSGPEGSIVFGGHLEDLVRTTAGSVDRVYKHTVWNIQRQNGEVGGTKLSLIHISEPTRRA